MPAIPRSEEACGQRDGRPVAAPMLRGMPARALTITAVLAVVALTLRAAIGMEPGLDYFTDASQAIDLLAAGNVSGFLQIQPLMGSFSLIVRAPFVRLVLYEDLDVVYYVGALPLLAGGIVLGLALRRHLERVGQGPAVQWLVAALAILNPLTFRALHWGHPEEILAGALCVGAVLAALWDRRILSAVLLGLALATKQWALLAVLPVLLATPSRRLGVLLVAGVIAAALTLPGILSSPQAFSSVSQNAALQTGSDGVATPYNVFWPLGSREPTPQGDRYFVPIWASTISHPLIVLVALPLSLLLWRRPDRRRDDALLLLALLFSLRCVLDTWNIDYYAVPFVLALLSWEAVRRPGVPRLTIAAILLLSVSYWGEHVRFYGQTLEDAPWLFALYMAWVLPLTAWLARTLYRPRT
ncbi:hypothetical protein C7Y72_19355 [Paraconexibacter algicola]|uniref:DUF2029 domain-containing protein n=2 Tax=Paraconexibacter algicola TaxID=2133960 RepID=A0A2T4UC16_9ACTN|nr:hypothetical protein C7Y72_19355 [Paraconexibacter algicola]